MTSSGKLFRSWAAAIGKARLPTVPIGGKLITAGTSIALETQAFLTVHYRDH